MRALLEDVAVLHIEYHVRVANGAQAVRYDEAGAAAHEAVHRVLYELLGVGVDVARGLVEYHYLGVRGHGPGDGQELSLALGDVLRARVEDEIIAAGQRADEAVDAGVFRGGLYLVPAHIILRVADVLAHRALEEPGVLQHHAEAVAQLMARHGARIDAVDIDCA